MLHEFRRRPLYRTADSLEGFRATFGGAVEYFDRRLASLGAVTSTEREQVYRSIRSSFTIFLPAIIIFKFNNTLILPPIKGENFKLIEGRKREIRLIDQVLEITSVKERVYSIIDNLNLCGVKGFLYLTPRLLKRLKTLS